jgi:NTP pyrophosphatase (non-canonical NTP hydrolase)
VSARGWKEIADEVRRNNSARMKLDSDLPLFGKRDREVINADFNRMERFYWLALAGEVGEGCNLAKKRWRDGPRWDDTKQLENIVAIREELCDVRIYVEALANLYGMNLDAECDKKMRKVVERPFAQSVKP